MQAPPQDYRDVPIDIQTSKLLDWLLDRRHCGRRWQAQARAVRQRMEAALRDMPEHPEIRQLLAGTALHYFHCLRIVEILRGTEASTRNLFGRYSSQRMKDWQEIVALYEKENTYLAELASLLVRSVSYEAPALRKQISRCQQAQQDFARREEECQLAAAELRERFYASCKQYGITGDNVRQELLALVKELPSLLSGIGAGASALTEAIELYEACVEFVCESSAEPVLPLLRHVGRRGNTTVYEWRTGLEPVRVERPEVQEVPEQPKEDAIDWGDFTLEPSGASDGAAAGGGAQDEIDWGITLEPSPQQDDGIDWGDGESDGAQISVVEAGTEGPEGVARGSEALTLLEHAETRNRFIDELMEVSGAGAARAPSPRGVGCWPPPPSGAVPAAGAVPGAAPGGDGGGGGRRPGRQPVPAGPCRAAGPDQRPRGLPAGRHPGAAGPAGRPAHAAPLHHPRLPQVRGPRQRAAAAEAEAGGAAAGQEGGAEPEAAGGAGGAGRPGAQAGPPAGGDQGAPAADRGRHLQALRRAAGEPDGRLAVSGWGPGPPPEGSWAPAPLVPPQRYRGRGLGAAQ
ncbi:CDK5 regulatory subunit-associated protein 3 isoform X1 [Cygnus olor]|uniref:CDK5 regulatory subunit-associated protein 3 isoform X1 n=1 Tax=Cygnus olor TaxID=8869 RepID=UPI001ADEA402|nr:CDK5 regulatory subunit-associated protein 3 isoform X1 [Cygnus olor]